MKQEQQEDIGPGVIKDAQDQDQKPIEIKDSYQMTNKHFNQNRVEYDFIKLSYQPFSITTLDIPRFQKNILQSSKQFLKSIVDRNQNRFLSNSCDSLLRLSGSRTYMWRMFMGIVPDDASQDRAKLISCLQNYRNLYFKKLDSVIAFKEQIQNSISEMSPLLDLQQQIIAETIEPQKPWEVIEVDTSRQSQIEVDIEGLNREREIIEVIQQDVDRTMQEFELFTQDEFKNHFQNMLYLWSKDNKDFGYRQGMNEILGMIIFAFLMEALSEGEPQQNQVDFSKPLTPMQVKNLSDNQITHFIFNTKYIYADIYWTFERIMSLGMRNMYQVQKDVSVLKQEIIREMRENSTSASSSGGSAKKRDGSSKRRDAMKAKTTRDEKPSSTSQNSFDKQVRERLEKACEEEKAKSVIVKRCERIYDQIIKNECEQLYTHLVVVNQMSPELQLMRWLKCMLAREFNEQSSLQCWDYILGGMYQRVISKYQAEIYFQSGQLPYNFKDKLECFNKIIPDVEEDPLLNLECLCATMVVIKKDILLESDFSMCLGSLWKYELNDPDDPSDVIARTINVKKNYLKQFQPDNGQSRKSLDQDNVDDFFDFETIEGDLQAFKEKFDNKSQQVLAPSKESKAKQQAKQSASRKFIPTFFQSKQSLANSVGSADDSKNKVKLSKEQQAAINKRERIVRNLSTSSRNLSVAAESNGETDEYKIVHTISKPFDGPGLKKKTQVEARDMILEKTDSTRFDDLDDLYGQRTLIKKKVVKEQSDNEMLQEEIARRKIQMQNAQKSLLKVDEFLLDIQSSSHQEQQTIDQQKLNDALTDLRDALNMLSQK